MNSVVRFVRLAERTVTFVALAVLVICVLWGAFTRYISPQPAAWTAELAGILFTWVVFIGAATAFRDGQHIRVGLLVDLAPPPLSRLVQLAANLIVVGFLAYATVLSVQMMQQGASRPSTVLRLPFSLVYLAPVLGFGLMTGTAILRLLGFAAEPAPIRPEDMP